MSYGEKIAEHVSRFQAVLESDEKILSSFYGVYNVKGFGGNPNLTVHR